MRKFIPSKVLLKKQFDIYYIWSNFTEDYIGNQSEIKGNSGRVWVHKVMALKLTPETEAGGGPLLCE